MAATTARRHEFGICVSGGGIRAAAFGLGALQTIQARTQLVCGRRPAGHITAVSGGSYIVGAMAMLKSKYDQPSAPEIPDPFGPGTPELEHLRRHARYLVGGLGGMVNLLIDVLIRLVLNLGFIFLVVFVPARVFGWFLGASLADLAIADSLGDDFQLGVLRAPTILGLVVLAVPVAVVLVLVLWMLSPSERWHRRILVLISTSTIVGTVLLAIGVMLPWALEAAVHLTSRDPQPAKPSSSLDLGNLRWIGGLSGAATLLTSLLGLRAANAPAPGAATKRGRIRSALAALGRGVLALVATVSVPVFLGVIAVAGVLTGATNVFWSPSEQGRGELLFVGILALVVSLLAATADPVKWSLYPFYKRRLMNCFCVTRYRHEESGETRAKAREYGSHYKLSESQPHDMPLVTICAAANISEFGESPAGQGVLPFVFTAERIGFPPDVVRGDYEHADFDVATVERAIDREAVLDELSWSARIAGVLRGPYDRSYVSMPSAIAVTGAAFSPLMGKMTISPFRALFALLNLRLGIWIPNPTNEKVRRQVAAAGHMSVSRRRAAAIFKELFGTQALKRKLVYVSDGGHYENLGLVELLRSGTVTTIFCIDSSGDVPGTTTTISEAMLLAEGELGICWNQPEGSDFVGDLSLDESAQTDRPVMCKTWTRIAFQYPQRPGVSYPNGRAGSVIVLKLGVSPYTDPHLQGFQRENKSFPHDSTGNQLFRADRFDAYVALGRDTARHALDAYWPSQ